MPIKLFSGASDFGNSDIVHAINYLILSYTVAKQKAEKIPNARFVSKENGAHLLLGHHEQVCHETIRFMEENAQIKGK